MKTLTTAIVGLGFLLGSALSAQDKFAGFYPTEDIDTPSYIISDEMGDKGHQTMASLKADSLKTFASFFPEESIDTPSYLIQGGDKGPGATYSMDSALKGVQYCAIFPVENVDREQHLGSC